MTKKSTAGFTLVELLVVVAIIAILSIIGMAIFTGVQKSARDARRKADIDAISKAFEAKYDYLTGKYQMPADSDYAAGTPPTDPKGTSYNPTLINNDTSFRACATLESSTQAYCKVGARGSQAVAGLPCAKFNDLTTGQSQSCKVIISVLPAPPTSSPIYIKCAEIPITLPPTLDCSVSSCIYLPNSQTNIPYYNSTTATTQSGTFIPVGQGCGYPQYTVILRD